MGTHRPCLFLTAVEAAGCVAHTHLHPQVAAEERWRVLSSVFPLTLPPPNVHAAMSSSSSWSSFGSCLDHVLSNNFQCPEFLNSLYVMPLKGLAWKTEQSLLNHHLSF